MFTALAFVLCSAAAGEGFVASQSGVLMVPPCFDEADGGLIPAVTYRDFVKRTVGFLLLDMDDWFKGPAVTDEAGNPLPAYFRYAKVRPDGGLYGDPVPDKGVVYPALHHSLAMEMFVSYYVYSGDEAGMREARRLADWNLAHSTPVEWPYGGLPYSTFVNGQPGGFVDGDAIMTDKPAIMALAYLRLYRMTGEAKYADGAKRIADVLVARQGEDGAWPFRVNPKTEEVREAYTSSVIYAVMLFDALGAAEEGSPYREPRARALKWILTNPVETMLWRGFYEDVGNAPENRTNWDCIDTARYLIAHTDEIPNGVALAKRLYAWMEENFVERDHWYAPAPGVREQKVCFTIMGGHCIHWAMGAIDLYRATGEAAYLRDAVQTMNFLTYHLQPDNRIIVGPGHGLKHPQGAPYWFSGQFSCGWLFLEALGKLPELAPEGETHILAETSGITDIGYAQDSVTYVALGAGDTTLRLAFTPAAVTVDGEPLADDAWNYDGETGVCRVAHGAGKVRIGY